MVQLEPVCIIMMNIIITAHIIMMATWPQTMPLPLSDGMTITQKTISSILLMRMGLGLSEIVGVPIGMMTDTSMCLITIPNWH